MIYSVFIQPYKLDLTKQMNLKMCSYLSEIKINCLIFKQPTLISSDQ